jgi:hypothetical protein
MRRPRLGLEWVVSFGYLPCWTEGYGRGWLPGMHPPGSMDGVKPLLPKTRCVSFEY